MYSSARHIMYTITFLNNIQYTYIVENSKCVYTNNQIINNNFRF